MLHSLHLRAAAAPAEDASRMKTNDHHPACLTLLLFLLFFFSQTLLLLIYYYYSILLSYALYVAHLALYSVPPFLTVRIPNVHARRLSRELLLTNGSRALLLLLLLPNYKQYFPSLTLRIRFFIYRQNERTDGRTDTRTDEPKRYCALFFY